MQVIESIIGKQNYELVRDRIYNIIVENIANQLLLNSDPFDQKALDCKIENERFIAIDKSDFPLINVSLARGSYEGKIAPTVNGTYTYNVDVYHIEISDQDEYFDQKASKLLQRTLGVIRAILENPIYKTLLFATPSISRLRVADLTIIDPNTMQNQDGAGVIWGRLSFEVVVSESVKLLDAIPIAGNDTLANDNLNYTV